MFLLCSLMEVVNDSRVFAEGTKSLCHPKLDCIMTSTLLMMVYHSDVQDLKCLIANISMRVSFEILNVMFLTKESNA